MAATMTASFLFLVSLPGPKSKFISCQTILTAARNVDNVLLLGSWGKSPQSFVFCVLRTVGHLMRPVLRFWVPAPLFTWLVSVARVNKA